MAVPADLKYIMPYIQRAQELAERDPVIAYYAQYYAAKMAISRGPSTKEVNHYLSDLLDKLEKMKASIGPNDAITNDDVGYAYIENFSLKVFLNADNEDRAGKASKKTAKTFLAASIFLELLKTFGDLDPEIEAKIKYSKWKAADIIKALKEGRVPTPGAPGESEAAAGEEFSEDMPSQPPSSISGFPSPPSNFTAPIHSVTPTTPVYPDQHTFNHPPQPPVIPSTSPQPPEAASPPVTPSQSASRPVAPVIQPPTYHQPPPAAPAVVPTHIIPPQPATIVDPGAIAASQKHAKWAISALNYDDIKSARTNLLAALNDIGFNQSNNFGY